MKRTVSLFVLAFVALAALAYDNEPTGFRALKWGDPVPAEWQKAAKKPGNIAFGAPNDEIYVNPKEDLKVGEVKVESIYYGFWRGKFCCAWIVFKDAQALGALKDQCIAQYGPPKTQRKTDPGGDLVTFSWLGNTSNVYLEKLGASPGKLTLQSVSVWEQRRAELLAGIRSSK